MKNELQDNKEKIGEDIKLMVKSLISSIIYLFKIIKLLLSIIVLGIWKSIKMYPKIYIIALASSLVIVLIGSAIQIRALKNSIGKYKYDEQVMTDSVNYYRSFLEKQAYRQPKHDTVYVIKKVYVQPIKSRKDSL